MKRTLSAIFVTLLLTACVDTTGISPASSKGPSPKSNANAVVSVVEYGDLQCPACRAAYTTVVQPLLQQYGSRISFEFKQFPLTTIHQYAMAAAEASECAADQGKFWDFVDIDYVNQDKLSSDIFQDWGKQLNLNMDLFNRCRDSHIKRKAILAEYDQGTNLGVQGTPTFFVNGAQVPTTMDALGKAINDAEASAGKHL